MSNNQPSDGFDVIMNDFANIIVSLGCRSMRIAIQTDNLGGIEKTGET